MIINNKLKSYPVLNQFFTLIIIFFIVTPPINLWIKLIILNFSFLIIFTSKFKEKLSLNYLYIFIFLFLFIPKFFIQNNSIIINHIVLPTSSTDKYDYVENNFDEEMSTILQAELDRIPCTGKNQR